MQGFLSPEEVRSLRRAQNQPLHVVNLLGLQIAGVPDSLDADAAFSSRERLMLLGIVAHLSDCIGACERIVLTPVPLHYARHTSRLASIFVGTLPFVLAPHLGLGLAPTMAFVTWALFGIQEIGLLIEDPFHSILKLDKICSSIQKDVQQTIEFGGFMQRYHVDVTEAPVPSTMRDGKVAGTRAWRSSYQSAERVAAPVATAGQEDDDKQQPAEDDEEASAEASVDRSSRVRPLDKLSLDDGDVIEASVTASRMQC